MKNKTIYNSIALITIGIFMNGCVDPFDIESITFESALVIEATITNEFKHQEVSLTRTFKFEEDGPTAEINAEVKIIDNFQNIYSFEEGELGEYSSVSKFQAEPNNTYKLLITTSNGRKYSSESMQLTNITPVFDISVSKEIKKGKEGISILANSFNPSGDSRYYRYDYEETYKIIAPFWSTQDLIIISDIIPFKVELQPRTKEERVCYNTISSNKIIQVSTNQFPEDKVSDFLIKFLTKDDFKISHRYSILVRQYVQSLDEFTFYQTLSKLSSSESLFSQNQPGFLSGNVFSLDSSNEKVIGYFGLSSVTSKRVFFNYRDFFPNGLPPHITNCDRIAPLLSEEGSSPLIDDLKAGYKYYTENDGPDENLLGPYLLVAPSCGDCTKIGSTKIPDFWIN